MVSMVVSSRKASLALVLLTVPAWTLAGGAAAGPLGLPVPLASAAGPSAGTGNAGSSFIAMTGACVPALRAGCAGMTTWHDGEFGVSSPGRVRVVATWESACLGCTEMKVYVGGLASATGKSPVTLDLGHVPSGTYAVSVFFGGPVVGSARQDVSWKVLYG